MTRGPVRTGPRVSGQGFVDRKVVRFVCGVYNPTPNPPSAGGFAGVTGALRRPSTSTVGFTSAATGDFGAGGGGVSLPITPAPNAGPEGAGFEAGFAADFGGAGSRTTGAGSAAGAASGFGAAARRPPPRRAGGAAGTSAGGASLNAKSLLRAAGSAGGAGASSGVPSSRRVS